MPAHKAVHRLALRAVIMYRYCIIFYLHSCVFTFCGAGYLTGWIQRMGSPALQFSAPVPLFALFIPAPQGTHSVLELDEQPHLRQLRENRNESLLYWGGGADPETEVAVAAGREEDEAVRGATIAGVVVPAAAAFHAVRTTICA